MVEPSSSAPFRLTPPEGTPILRALCKGSIPSVVIGQRPPGGFEMKLRVSEIPDEGLQLADPAALGGVYPDPGWTLDAIAVFVELRGQTVAVSGRFEATARLACGRCLEPLVTQVAPEVDLQFVPQPSGRQGEVELGPDDLEVDFYQGDLLDVGSLLRSETDLALPMKPLCR